MKIPFVDLPAQHRALERELTAAMTEVLGKCDFILGGAVEALEREFAEFVGAKFAVGVGTGLDALALSLRAAGIGPGDEVILPANTYIATALAVSVVGARPVLVDVDEATFNLSPARVAAALTPRTKAILPVHLYGQPCEIGEIIALAKKHDLVVIEDACQSHGARFGGQSTGTFGLAAGFSFYPGKNLGACGDGGLAVTNDPDLAARLRRLRNYGQEKKYVHREQGINSRLDTLQAAIVRIKLRHLPRWNTLRAQHAAAYGNQLAGISEVQCPVIAPDRSHVFHLYVIRVSRRAALQKHLSEAGIETGIHYPTPIHLQEAYSDLGYKRGDFPITEKLADEILSLPLFPELTKEQIDFVCSSIREVYR